MGTYYTSRLGIARRSGDLPKTATRHGHERVTGSVPQARNERKFPLPLDLKLRRDHPLSCSRPELLAAGLNAVWDHFLFRLLSVLLDFTRLARLEIAFF